MTEQEEAKEAWTLKQIRECETMDKANGYSQGISDFKSALRAKIEGELVIMSRIDELYKAWFLSLLDTLTPKES